MAKRDQKHEDWVRHLREQGLRLTCCRRGLLQVLDQAEGPLTVEQLAQGVAHLHDDHSHDLSTIYRTVETLRGKGIVRRVEFGDGAARYELNQGHNHYVRCVRCGRTEAIGKCDLGELTRRVEKQLGYAVTGHHLHLTGLCRRCRQG